MISETFAFVSINSLLIIYNSSYEFLILFLAIIFIALTAYLAYSMGKKRQIGSGWSLFFFCFFFIIGGLVITLLSKRDIENTPKRSLTKIVIGWILALLFGLSTLIALPQFSSTRGNLFSSIGLCGLGIYLIQIGEGKILNKRMLKEISKRKEQSVNTETIISNKAEYPAKANFE